MTSPRFVWLHFAIIGALCFALQQLWVAHAAVPEALSLDDRVVLQASDDELLYREAIRRGLDRSDSVVYQRLVRNMRFLASDARDIGDDEVLYREALALGLDRSDAVVRRRLVEAVRQRLIADSDIARPDDAALQAHLLVERERFLQPSRRRVEQLYFETEERAVRALATFAETADGAAPTAVPEDALPIPRRLPPLSERELGARFGEDFARAVFALPVGVDARPIASSYGVHLARVVEDVPARLPLLEEVRGALTAHWIADREEAALRRAVAELRVAAATRQPSVAP